MDKGAATDSLYFEVSLHVEKATPFGFSGSVNHEFSGTYLSCGPFDIKRNIGSMSRPGPVGSLWEPSYVSVIEDCSS